MINNTDILDMLHKQLEQSGHISLRASGKSMGGPFENADSLVISSIEKHTPHIGDVVVVAHQNQWKVHRLLYRCFKQDVCITMGDAMHSIDRPLPQKCDIIGTVTAIKTNGDSIHIAGPRRRIINLMIVFRSTLRLLRTRLL